MSSRCCASPPPIIRWHLTLLSGNSVFRSLYNALRHSALVSNFCTQCNSCLSQITVYLGVQSSSTHECHMSGYTPPQHCPVTIIQSSPEWNERKIESCDNLSYIVCIGCSSLLWGWCRHRVHHSAPPPFVVRTWKYGFMGAGAACWDLLFCSDNNSQLMCYFPQNSKGSSLWDRFSKADGWPRAENHPSLGFQSD